MYGGDVLVGEESEWTSLGSNCNCLEVIGIIVAYSLYLGGGGSSLKLTGVRNPGSKIGDILLDMSAGSY